jgi:hypothetical protein
MTTKSKIRHIIFIVIIIVPFIFGTSPRPAPYDEYSVTGKIVRQSGGPKQNYVVSLLGYSKLNRPDTIFALRSSSGLDYGVTDTSGYFRIDIVSSKVDSLTIVVTAADKATFVSTKWFSPTGSVTLYDENTYTEPGCGGCATETKMDSYVKGYVRTFQLQTVLIPD